MPEIKTEDERVAFAEALGPYVEAIEKADAICPARRSRIGGRDCPKCGASVNEGCRPVSLAESRLANRVRSLLTRIKSERDEI